MKSWGKFSVEKGKSSPTQHLVERHLLLYVCACWRQPVSHEVSSGHGWVRNEAKLQNPLKDINDEPLARNFHLANNRDTARRYLSNWYDQIYPHFRIEDEIRQVLLGERVILPSMMLIFRGNFTEVVEITTTFTATPKGEQKFDSYIHVTCIVRKIDASTGPTEETKDGKFTKLLKELVHLGIPKEYFEELTKVKKKKDLTPALQLSDAFAKLKVEDKNV